MKQMHQKEKTMRMINEEITTNKITSDLLDAVEEIRTVIDLRQKPTAVSNCRYRRSCVYGKQWHILILRQDGTL
jgi:hypothetical protein